MLKNKIFKMMMPVMSKMTPTCEVVTKKISESMDHQISTRDRLRIRIHLLGCEFCARYEKQLTTIRQMIESNIDEMNETAAGPNLTSEAKLRIRKKIEQEKKK